MTYDHHDMTDDLTGRRVELENKSTGQIKRGEIVSDPPMGETRFRTDDGEEVGAYEWFFRTV